MNTSKHNMEFQLTWCETNLHYLYGTEDLNNAEIKRKIAFMESEIERLKYAINTMRF